MFQRRNLVTVYDHMMFHNYSDSFHRTLNMSSLSVLFLLLSCQIEIELSSSVKNRVDLFDKIRRRCT